MSKLEPWFFEIIFASPSHCFGFSSFSSFASPSRVSAETASIQGALEEEVLEQDALEQVAVAFAMMAWLPRLEGACDQYKKGFLPSLNCQRLIVLSTKAMVLKTQILKRLKHFRNLWSY